MMRSTQFLIFVVWLLVPGLALPGGARDKGDIKKDDGLIVAMKFVKVPKGKFWMGWDTMGKKSKQVEIKDDFELAAYLVTQEQWEKVMGNNPSWFSRKGARKNAVKDISEADLKRFPVDYVSWFDVREFLKKLNEREKGRGWTYRLPTEAEWEYACRGGATSKEDCFFDFYFDKPTNDLSSTQANFNGDVPAGDGKQGPYLGRPTKVGSYAPNKLGLYDMHGNVYQWCADMHGGSRGLRGGSWNAHGFQCSAGHIGGDLPAVRNDLNGFRLARIASGLK